MSVPDYYELTLELLDKTQETPTRIPTTGRVINGNIEPFKHLLELTNTGNSKTNSGVLTLRIPQDGTFVRIEPILVDEGAKDEYIIQAQIRQADGAGGVRKGKIFRFTIGSPTIQDDIGQGETLKLSLIPTEYRLKEHLQSKQLKFVSPQLAFQTRLIDYNATKGVDEPALFFGSGDIALPDDDENLKQNYEPRAPTKTWDLFKEITDRLSLPPIAGGTFQDFYFDFEANSSPAFSGNLTNGSTKTIDMKAEIFGLNDSGIILDPLALSSPVDAERDKTIRTDLIKFKNNVIMEGGARGGSLPVERSIFSSMWQHGQNRPGWGSSVTYHDGKTSPFGQSLVKTREIDSTSGIEYIRYFEFIGTEGDSSTDNPVGASQSDWLEDFTTIPAYSPNAIYGEKELVYIDDNTSGTVTFFVLEDLKTHQAGDTIPSSNNDWSQAFNTIPSAQHTAFFSYTPWTSDYSLQLANISARKSPPTGKNFAVDSVALATAVGDILVTTHSAHCLSIVTKVAQTNFSNANYNGQFVIKTVPTVTTYTVTATFGTTETGLVSLSGYIGVVPDWNFERANFDRVKSDDQFEQVSLKAVVRAEKNPTSIPAEEIVNGARFLINGVGTVGTDFETHDNKVAEFFKPPFITNGVWKFSKAPADFEPNEMVTDLHTGQVWGWGGSSWAVKWTPTSNNGVVSSPFHAVSNGVNIGGGTTGFGLVKGATQIPGQAIRLSFDWDQVQDKLNLSSRGAWWVQHFPIPRIGGLGGHTVGDVYANSTLDTTNLDLDSKGQQGWNNGLDSEDLGRISAVTMKVRLLIRHRFGSLINIANMPFKAWAIDIFGRIWFTDFTVRRNGQYSFVRIQFGENATQKLHHNRIDELFKALGFDFSQNFFLKEKQFTGIEFDWRFVKSWGIFWNVSYDDNGMYVGVRDHFIKTLTSWMTQVGSYLLSAVTVGLINQGEFVIDTVTLDIDELGFEKQLYANSDDVAVPNARTELDHLSEENDYLNLKGRAQASKARKKFVNQEWHILAHGDVRMRLGEKFKITGDRVPENANNPNYIAWVVTPKIYSIGDKVTRGGFVWQSLQNLNIAKIPESSPEWWQNLNESVCAEVKHVIDNDGYTMQVLGVRKFIFTS